MDDAKFKLPGFTKTFLFIVVLGLIALGLLAVALKPTSIITKSGMTQIPLANGAQTTLTISSNPTEDASPSAYKTAVNIDSGGNKITAVQLELSYNPKVLQNVDILPGTFFENSSILLKNIDAQNGRITYALRANNSAAGKGSVAEISFSVIPGSETTPIAINFEPKTQVSAEGITQSAIKSLTGSLFILKQPQQSSPTPQKTATDSAY